MSGRNLSVGGNCDSYCTRCKMDLAHTIVAMVEDTPVQVICNTCNGAHKYRAPKSAAKAPRSAKATTAKTSSTRAPRATGTKKAQSEAAEAKELKELRRRWDEEIGKHADTPSRAYNVRESFGKDEVIEHKTFGLGFVVEELHDKRIKVLFKDAERTLVCRHGS